MGLVSSGLFHGPRSNCSATLSKDGLICSSVFTLGGVRVHRSIDSISDRGPRFILILAGDSPAIEDLDSLKASA